MVQKSDGYPEKSETSLRAEEQFPLVHQVWFSTLPDPEDIPANCQAIRRLVGDSRYRLWTLDSTRTFLAQYFDPSVTVAFDRLKPFAYKADLARYCIVHRLGGFYLDHSVNDVAFPNTGDLDFIGFRDPNNEVTSWKMANNFFFAKAGSLILADSIQQVLENCERNYYGKDPHFPTGPSVFGRSVAKLSPEMNVLIGEYYMFKRRRNKYLLPDYGVVGRGKLGVNSGGISGIPGGNNYNDLWIRRDVYLES